MKRIFVAAALAVLAAPAVASAYELSIPAWATYVRGPGWPVSGYFPDRAHRAEESGYAVIHCRMTDASLLGHCRVTSESQPGLGFGQAALVLSDYLLVGAGAPIVNGEIDVRIDFQDHIPRVADLPEATGGQVKEPLWLRRPDATEVRSAYDTFINDDSSGAAGLNCRVSLTGQLVNCVVTRQSDASFGHAALHLATLYRMKSVDAQGAPVAGRSIRVPFTFSPN